jgi:hypothetical protein
MQDIHGDNAVKPGEQIAGDRAANETGATCHKAGFGRHRPLLPTAFCNGPEITFRPPTLGMNQPASRLKKRIGAARRQARE